MRFLCVNDDVPLMTTQLLAKACRERGIEYAEVHAPSFVYEETKRARQGDILFWPAISLAAIRVEQFLYRDGVATFYSDPEGIYFNPMNSLLLFERAGLPVPRTFFCTTSERGLLDAFVDRPGGFPVITKIPGSSRGIEVIRADSRSSLYSTLDYLLATNIAPYLCAYVNNSTHGD